MALIVLDASVVIAHLDPSDAHHSEATALLLEHADDDLRLPASAYAETLVDPARAEKSMATLRAIAHGSSFHAPSAQPNESITRRFTSWTTAPERSS